MRGRQNQLYHILVDPYIIIYHILWDEHPSTIILYHKIGCSPGFQGFDPFAIIFLTRWDGQLEPNDAFFVHRLQERSLSHAAKCKKTFVNSSVSVTMDAGCWRMNRPYMKNDSWLSSFCVYPRLEAEHSWDSIAGSKPTANKTEDRLAMVNAFQLLECKKSLERFNFLHDDTDCGKSTNGLISND